MLRSMLALGLVLLAALLCQAALPVYDDALFFRRFAINLIDHGVWGWNAADGPVHGNTSQLWQLVALGLTAMARDWTILTGRLVLASCIMLSGWLLMRRYPTSRPIVVLGLVSPVALATVVSGMETATTLALGAALVAMPRAGGLFTVLLYLARPDTLLMSVPTLVLRRQWAALVGSGAVLLVFLGIFHGFYGSAFPLSFSVKMGLSGLYDAHFLELSAEAGRRHLLFFSLLSAPLVALGWRSRLMLPAAVFFAFHALATVDVMGLHGRFYAPCIPWLVAAAAQEWSKSRRGGLWMWVVWAITVGVSIQQGLLPGAKGWSIGQVSLWTYAAYVLAAGAMLWRGRWAAHVQHRGAALVIIGIVASQPSLPSQSLSDSASVARLRDLVTSWRGLERATDCLGTDLHVYHSEIGVPGFYFARVTDLGGLMNKEAHQGVRFEEMCLRDRPELLFMPHRNYKELNAEIRRGACLRDYKRVIKRSSSPMFVRRDLVQEYRSSPRCSQED